MRVISYYAPFPDRDPAIELRRMIAWRRAWSAAEWAKRRSDPIVITEAWARRHSDYEDVNATLAGASPRERADQMRWLAFIEFSRIPIGGMYWTGQGNESQLKGDISALYCHYDFIPNPLIPPPSENLLPWRSLLRVLEPGVAVFGSSKLLSKQLTALLAHEWPDRELTLVGPPGSDRPFIHYGYGRVNETIDTHVVWPAVIYGNQPAFR